jgi:hypothetical protein
MKTIHLEDTPRIRDPYEIPKIITLNKNCAVELTRSLEEFLVVVYYRFPTSRWWEVNRWVMEVGERDIAFPENMPSRIAAYVVNKLLGRNEVRIHRDGAGCPQCKVRHGEWAQTSVGLHCTLCGWVSGTVPRGHVRAGDRFWLPDNKVIAHPDTMVRVLAAHNQVTALCSPAPELWASPGELPKHPIRLGEVREAVPNYAYIQVEVVSLPVVFLPIRE